MESIRKLISDLRRRYNQFCHCRRPENRRDRKLVLSDLKSFRKKVERIRKRRRINASEQGIKVLFSGFHKQIVSSKIEGLIGAGLLERGATPIVVLQNYFSLNEIENYYKACGIEEFVYLSDFEDSNDVIDAQELFPRDEIVRLSKKELLSIDYTGVKVGSHALSSFIRQSYVVDVDFSSIKFRELIWEKLIRSVCTCMAVTRLFEKIVPLKVVVNEKGYTPNGEFFDLAVSRSIDTLQYCASSKNDAYQFKRYNFGNKSMHPASLNLETWSRVKNEHIEDGVLSEFLREHWSYYEGNSWYDRVGTQSGKKILAREKLYSELNIPPQRKTAVIFAHILWDASFFYGEDIFEDYSDWLVQTVKAACANNNLTWLIKLHPVNAWRLKMEGFEGEAADYQLLKSKVGNLPEHVRIIAPESTISTASFFKVIDYCVTVRGTVGMEFPMYGVPTLTAGTGRYSGFGFTNDSRSVNEYLEKLLNLHTCSRLSEQQIRLARLYSYTLFNLKPLPWRSIRIDYLNRPETNRFFFPSMDFLRTDAESISSLEDFSTVLNWILKSDSPDLIVNR